jgi:VWFA-related protein
VQEFVMTMSARGLGLLVALGMGVFGWAQAPVAEKVDSKQVRLDVTVLGADGAPVAGLAGQGFKLRDFAQKDNKASVPITSFKAVAVGQSPVDVIVLIDAVNIPFSSVSYVRAQVAKFLRTDEGKLAQPTTIAVLSDKGLELLEDFTKDGNGLASDLEKTEIGLRTIGRGGGFWGAKEQLQISMKAIQDLGDYGARLPGRKAVLWISPGWPLLSGPEVELNAMLQKEVFDNIVSLSTDLRQGRVTIYNINPLGAAENLGRAEYYTAFLKGVSKPSQAQLGDLGLQVLAVQSGGLALVGSTDVAGMLKRCVGETAAWYEIGFEMAPEDKPYEYHHVG